MPIYIMAIENEDDRAFITELYLEYKRLMYKSILQIVHDAWIADDVMQSTLENLIKKVKELREKDRTHLVNYIITACKNNARNYIKYKNRHPEVSIDEWIDTPNVLGDRTEIEGKIIDLDEKQSLISIWSQLDPTSQFILESYYILERTADDISNDLGIKPSSVRMALTRARRKARELMESE